MTTHKNNKKKEPKDISYKFRFYNIVIQPVGKQSPENYEMLFRKMFEKNTPVSVYGKYHLKFKSMDFKGEMITGQLVKYMILDGKDWYNSETNEIENIDVDPSLHPNVKVVDYAFSTKYHRMALSAEVPVDQVLKFIDALIAIASDGTGMEVKTNVISTRQSIENIRTAKDVTKLIIQLSYSNGDNYDEWDALMDNDMKDSDVRDLKIEASSTRGNPLKIDKSRMLSSALALARNNGTASATVYENGYRQVLSTQSSPEEKTIKSPDRAGVLSQFKDLIASII